ncbi:MAG: PHB depolymerase family esterase [Burkholderiales bacterium]|nr:PHB depolymerase family esterase [Burkholderiales bacterium]
MNPDYQRLMQEATRLTQAGNLQGATAAIQAALGGAQPSAAYVPADFIDVAAREVPGTETKTPASPQGSFIAGSSSGAGPGRRDYKLFVPPNAASHALPLVVMLHGCTQAPDDFAAGTAMNDAALAQGFFVLYPAQSQQANPQRCWNWFKHSHQERGRGEPALLAAMTREVMAAHAIDPRRVYVAGLSAGGAMAAILGETYPDLFAAVGVHSGLAAGAAKDLPSALGAMKSGGAPVRRSASGVPTIVFHGDADATVNAANGEQVIAASAAAGARVERQQGKAAGGRAYTRSVHHSHDGTVLAEHWLVHGAPHAWSGGSPRGSYTDARGPDASAEMVRFFLAHPRPPAH